MNTVENVRKEIGNAKSRLDGLMRIPRKSDVDYQLIDDLREYIASLFENLGELRHEQIARREYDDP